MQTSSVRCGWSKTPVELVVGTHDNALTVEFGEVGEIGEWPSKGPDRDFVHVWAEQVPGSHGESDGFEPERVVQGPAVDVGLAGVAGQAQPALVVNLRVLAD